MTRSPGDGRSAGAWESGCFAEHTKKDVLKIETDVITLLIAYFIFIRIRTPTFINYPVIA